MSQSGGETGYVTFTPVCRRCGRVTGPSIVEIVSGDLGKVPLPVSDDERDGLCDACRAEWPA